MAAHSGNRTRLLCGRMFTAKELNEVGEMVHLFPHLSFHELSLSICESLDWFAPNGKYKMASCKNLLRKLESEGRFVLPEVRSAQGPHGKEAITPGAETDAGRAIEGTTSDVHPVRLAAVTTKEDRQLWNAYIERYHELGYKRPFGANLRYFIHSDALNQRLGCLLFSGAAWALADRDAWIGWQQDERSQRLRLVVNNTRFLLFPWVKVKNLASQVLALAAKQVAMDWQERYGNAPVLLETFVDMERYRGTCCRAANWIDVGQTAGRGRMDRYKQYPSSPKRIYMYPLRRDFRDVLCSEGGASL